ncbi:MAG: FtsW/RodA/SpoVE family cell cycle protein, partial [Mailhella sp.]|nr:FtsW/RodA/SpoVE family cell cycle protein [Mailhella sp.]
VEPYRLARFISFLDPFADRQGGGYQVVQGLLAMGTGGIFGVGLGGSVQKISHLPEAHNDFIMAVIGEETGFVGITFVICLFVAFFWRCYKVALGQPVLRDKLTAYGLTVAMALSFTMNFAVILSLMPPKGVAMPFISYGGSSLLSNMICAGLLLHYSRTARE